MFTSTTPYCRSLGDGLILKSLHNEQDAERITAFSGTIHGPDIESMMRSMIFHHPYIRPEHWLFVEDEKTGQVVSMLVYIPWQWRYEDVTLKSGEVGIVGTEASYRHRGIIRALMARHHELLLAEGCVLSHIQGIPYFYRQFGYEYAMPLEANWHVPLHNLPDAPSPAASAYRFRPATLDDLPLLMQLYDEAGQRLGITTVRDAATWRYLFEHTDGTEMSGEYWLLLDAAGQPAGYWRINHFGFGKGLRVSETSVLSHTAAEAVLFQLRDRAQARNKPDIRLNLPASSDLVRIARVYAAYDEGAYAWQMHIADVAGLLRKLAPVLERRIACSPFAGLDETVSIDLYREAFDLRFERGKLLAVEAVGFRDSGSIHIPPLLLAPLVLGYRSREELRKMAPDVSIWGMSQALVDVLFPPMDSFIYTIY